MFKGSQDPKYVFQQIRVRICGEYYKGKITVK